MPTRKQALPGDILSELLAAMGVGQSELARRIAAADGKPCAFHNVHRWTKNREFTAENQRRAALGLGVAVDSFACPNVAAEREGQVRAMLDRFLATHPLAKRLTAADVATLRSLRFPDPNRTVEPAFFEAVALALTHHIRPNEVAQVAADNAALDRTLRDKPPLKRR